MLISETNETNETLFFCNNAEKLKPTSKMKEVSPIFLSGNGTPRSLKCRVIQSPLAGVSDQIFRNFVRRWSPNALLFTEMVNAKSLELGHGEEKVIELLEERGPIGVQLFDHR